MFESDYDLQSIQLITAQGTGIPLFITPRYLEHYVEHEYEPFSIQILRTYLPKNGHFLDVGAHYGYYSLVASKFCQATVTAVEAVPFNFALLSKNFVHNTVKAKDIIHAAASDRPGIVNFNITEASDSAGFYQHPLTATKSVLQLNAIRLDDIVAEQPIDFIKIDVEGHECAVLDGLEKTFTTHPDLKLLIEFNPKCQRAAGRDPGEMLEKLERAGFDLYVVAETERQLYRLRSVSGWSEFVGPQAYVNIFCVPKNTTRSILFFSHSAELGGAESSLLRQIELLQAAGDICQVVFPTDKGKFITALQGRAVPYSVVPYYWWAGKDTVITAKSLTVSLKNTLAYTNQIKKINPHLIYTSTATIPWGAIAARFLQLPHIWHVKEYLLQDHGLASPLSMGAITQTIAATSQAVLANSQAVAKFYNDLLPTPVVKPLYYSFPSLPEKIPVTENYFPQEARLKVLVAGTVQEGKGQGWALRAVQELLAEGHDIELTILGFTSHQSKYEQELQEKFGGDKQIHLHQKAGSAWPAIAQADVVVVPSISEAFGRIAVEAMQLEKPVIASNAGGLPEIVTHEQTGLLFEVGNVNDLKKQLLRYYQDTTLMTTHGKNARAFVTDKFMDNQFVPQLHQVFEEVLHSPVVAVPSEIVTYLLDTGLNRDRAFAHSVQEAVSIQLQASQVHRIHLNAKNQELASQNKHLIQVNQDLQVKNEALYQHNGELGAQVEHLHQEITDLNQKIAELNVHNTRLRMFEQRVLTGKMWRLFTAYFKLRDRLLVWAGKKPQFE